jgi:hypothetical protein
MDVDSDEDDSSDQRSTSSALDTNRIRIGPRKLSRWPGPTELMSLPQQYELTAMYVKVSRRYL